MLASPGGHGRGKTPVGAGGIPVLIIPRICNTTWECRVGARYLLVRRLIPASL